MVIRTGAMGQTKKQMHNRYWAIRIVASEEQESEYGMSTISVDFIYVSSRVQVTFEYLSP